MMGVFYYENIFSWKIIFIALITIFRVVLVIAPGVLGLEYEGDKGIELDWTYNTVMWISISVVYMFAYSTQYNILSKTADKVSSM